MNYSLFIYLFYMKHIIGSSAASFETRKKKKQERKKINNRLWEKKITNATNTSRCSNGARHKEAEVSQINRNDGCFIV